MFVRMSKQKRKEINYLYFTVELEVAQNVIQLCMFSDRLILRYSRGCAVQPRQSKTVPTGFRVLCAG